MTGICPRRALPAEPRRPTIGLAMIYRFESFELDQGTFELRAAGSPCPLPGRGFDVLLLLLEHAGRVVTKREIFAAVWKGERVGESVLPVHVRTIRRALGARASAILHTVRGRGYIIGCRVERIEGPETPGASAARRAARRSVRLPTGDPLAALSQVSGVFSLALVLGDLDLAGHSLDWLVARDS